jgi:hypothetical protein
MQQLFLSFRGVFDEESAILAEESDSSEDLGMTSQVEKLGKLV